MLTNHNPGNKTSNWRSISKTGSPSIPPDYLPYKKQVVDVVVARVEAIVLRFLQAAAGLALGFLFPPLPRGVLQVLCMTV